MEKTFDTEHEVIFSSKDPARSQIIHRSLKAGKLKKLSPRLYTSNLLDVPENIIKRNLYHILGGLFPGAILSHRTTLEGGPSKEGVVVLTYKYTKKRVLPGLIVRLIKGEGPQTGDIPFLGNLFLASRERALLENFQPSRDKGASAKTLSRAYLEEYLERLCRTYNLEVLNHIRDQVRYLAAKLNLNKEFEEFEKIIGALLGSTGAR